MASRKLIRQRLQLMLAVESDDLPTVRTLLEKSKLNPDFSTDTGVLMYDPEEAEDWEDDEWEQLKDWQDNADDWVSLTSPLWEARDKPDVFDVLRPKASMDLFLTKLLVPVCFDDEDEFRDQLSFLEQYMDAESIGQFFDDTIQDGSIMVYRLEDDDGQRHAFTPEKLARYRRSLAEATGSKP